MCACVCVCVCVCLALLKLKQQKRMSLRKLAGERFLFALCDHIKCVCVCVCVCGGSMCVHVHCARILVETQKKLSMEEARSLKFVATCSCTFTSLNPL